MGSIVALYSISFTYFDKISLTCFDRHFVGNLEIVANIWTRNFSVSSGGIETLVWPTLFNFVKHLPLHYHTYFRL